MGPVARQGFKKRRGVAGFAAGKIDEAAAAATASGMPARGTANATAGASLSGSVDFAAQENPTHARPVFHKKKCKEI